MWSWAGGGSAATCASPRTSRTPDCISETETDMDCKSETETGMDCISETETGMDCISETETGMHCTCISETEQEWTAYLWNWNRKVLHFRKWNRKQQLSHKNFWLISLRKTIFCDICLNRNRSRNISSALRWVAGKYMPRGNTFGQPSVEINLNRNWNRYKNSTFPNLKLQQLRKSFFSPSRNWNENHIFPTHAETDLAAEMEITLLFRIELVLCMVLGCVLIQQLKIRKRIKDWIKPKKTLLSKTLEGHIMLSRCRAFPALSSLEF